MIQIRTSTNLIGFYHFFARAVCPRNYGIPRLSQNKMKRLYNHAEWNLAFRKFSVLSYVKEILVDNKHLRQPPSLYEKVSLEIGYAIVVSLANIFSSKGDKRITMYP